MALSLNQAWAQAQIIGRGPDSIQSQTRHFEKGLEILSFYSVKIRGLAMAQAQLPRIKVFGHEPSLQCCVKELKLDSLSNLRALRGLPPIEEKSNG